MRPLPLLLLWLATALPLCAQVGYSEKGEASYYSDKFHGRSTSSGERFDIHKFTAAHRTLPFGTLVRVENQDNGKSVVVRVNDRGPFKPGRIIDVSPAAARELDLIREGVAAVRIEVVELPKGAAGDSKSKPAKPPKPAKTKPVKASKRDKTPLVAFSKKGVYDLEGKPADPSGDWGVQIGAFSELSAARALATRVRNAGYRRVYIQVVAAKAVPYKVLVGVFEDADDARLSMQELKQQGYQPFPARYH